MSTPTETREGATTDEAYAAFLGELRAEFARRRLKQSRVAPAMGMHQQHLSNRLIGKTPFTVPELLRLADAIDVSPVTLLGWAPRGSNPQPTGLRPESRRRWRWPGKPVLYGSPVNHPALVGFPSQRQREGIPA